MIRKTFLPSSQNAEITALVRPPAITEHCELREVYNFCSLSPFIVELKPDLARPQITNGFLGIHEAFPFLNRFGVRTPIWRPASTRPVATSQCDYIPPLGHGECRDAPVPVD